MIGEPTLQQIVKRIVAAAQPSRIILSGIQRPDRVAGRPSHHRLFPRAAGRREIAQSGFIHAPD